MANRVAASNIWEVPKDGLTAFVRVYERKESGRYGFTLTQAQHNASLVQDTASGDVFFQDTVVEGTWINLIDGRMSILSLAPYSVIEDEQPLGPPLELLVAAESRRRTLAAAAFVLALGGADEKRA